MKPFRLYWLTVAEIHGMTRGKEVADATWVDMTAEERKEFVEESKTLINEVKDHNTATYKAREHKVPQWVKKQFLPEFQIAYDKMLSEKSHGVGANMSDVDQIFEILDDMKK